MILKEIQTLDPEKDHERIVFLSTCYEFPFDTTRGDCFVLTRSNCCVIETICSAIPWALFVEKDD
jgi:hypothetical protein